MQQSNHVWPNLLPNVSAFDESGLSTPSAELLDPSSLSTVLDMLAVIDSAEELTLLEVLTPAQKRQVWDAISEALKNRLKQIRAGVSLADASLGAKPSVPPIAQLDVQTIDALDEGTEDVSLADLEADLQEVVQAELHHPLPQVGDRVILIAKPQLPSAEIQAIWELVELEEDAAQIYAKGLGTRRYPTSWLIVYPA